MFPSVGTRSIELRITNFVIGNCRTIVGGQQIAPTISVIVGIGYSSGKLALCIVGIFVFFTFLNVTGIVVCPCMNITTCGIDFLSQLISGVILVGALGGTDCHTSVRTGSQ